MTKNLISQISIFSPSQIHPVARGFIPVRLRSSRKLGDAIDLKKRVEWIGGRFAAQRG